MPYATIIIIMLDMYLFVFILISDITFEPIVLSDKSNLDIGQIEWLFLLYAKILKIIFYLILYIYHIFFIKNK